MPAAGLKNPVRRRSSWLTSTPRAALSKATAVNGAAASSSMTMRSWRSVTPDCRSSANGRRRSSRPPATASAMLAPATAIVMTTPSMTMRPSSFTIPVNAATTSAPVAGPPVGIATSRAVRARSIVALAPSVAATTNSGRSARQSPSTTDGSMIRSGREPGGAVAPGASRGCVGAVASNDASTVMGPPSASASASTA